MSQIRFHITQGDGDITTTDWEEELIRVGIDQTAVMLVSRLRTQYPEAAIAIERRGDVRIPRQEKMFRYKIFVKKGVAQVTPNPENPMGIIELKNTTLQSRSFQESEREKVLADIKERFPKAVLTEESL